MFKLIAQDWAPENEHLKLQGSCNLFSTDSRGSYITLTTRVIKVNIFKCVKHTGYSDENH